MRGRIKYVVPVTLQVSREQYKFLHDKVVSKIRAGEGDDRASITEEIRALIRADMERVDA